MPEAPYMFSMRIIYDKSDRHFEMDANLRYEIDIEDENGSWVPFGGPAVAIYANDGVRSCQVAFGLEKFVETFAEAVSRFSKLDITYASGAETAAEQMRDRNEFLRHAANRYPAILSELNRTLRRLADEVEAASVRIATIRFTP
ncbi:MAG: hypothetical protein ACOY45_08275 [Pseudomonadota bacterium]